jgi:hypothetical protein
MMEPPADTHAARAWLSRETQHQTTPTQISTSNAAMTTMSRTPYFLSGRRRRGGSGVTGVSGLGTSFSSGFLGSGSRLWWTSLQDATSPQTSHGPRLVMMLSGHPFRTPQGLQ